MVRNGLTVQRLAKQSRVGKCATSEPTVGMPSRVLPPGTREDETSTILTSPSYQSASPGLESYEAFPEEEPRNKSGTQRQRSQSLAGEGTDLSSSTAAEHHPREVSTPAGTGATPPNSKIQNYRGPSPSPSQLQALADQRSSPAASYFARQPGASSLDARFPFTRRAPASRSSHGIETLSGPPPALSTQRSYTVDSSWSHIPPVDLKPSIYQAHNKKPACATRDITSSAAEDGFEDEIAVRSGKLKARMTIPKRPRDEQIMGNDQDQTTLRDIDFLQPNRSKDRDQASKERLERQSQSSHEDLFLKMAQTDGAADGDSDLSHQKQRRRVRHVRINYMNDA